MKFRAKMLRKGGQAVFVLMEAEGKNASPVAVVTSEKQANLWRGKDAKHRDWFMLYLDELPEDLQPLPPEPTPTERQKFIEDTRKDVQQMHGDVRDLLKNLRNKRK